MPSWATLTRASANATFFDGSGVLQTAATDAARFDHDIATPFAAKGLLTEEARTNIILWNRDLTNVAWVAVTMTVAKDQTGIDNVANSASSLLAAAGNAIIHQPVVLASSIRGQSAYVKRITGTGTVNMTQDNGVTWTAITVTSAWTKVTVPVQTLVNPNAGFQIVTSGDKIAVDFVQNEAATSGGLSTSPIATTTVAVTRASDNIVARGVAGAGMKDSNTVAVRFQLTGLPTNGGGKLIIGSGFVGFIIEIDGTGLFPQALSRSGIVTTQAMKDSAQYGTAIIQVSLCSGAFPFASIQGKTVLGTSPGASLKWVDNFYIGSHDAADSWLTGWIIGLAIYRTELPQQKQNMLCGLLRF